MVNSAPGFEEQPAVINGASDLLIERILGAENPITLRARNNLAHWARMADGVPGSGTK